MAYFDCIVGGSGKGNTLVVTCADDLAGATITCTNGTKTYTKTCPSTAPYEVTFYGLEAGTWTVSAAVSGNTYTTTVVVVDCAALLGGFNWRTWVDTARFLDSTDYNSLDDVLADEEAVRELCLEHACVDYMANVASSNADLETIIENDLFAKWVNNSDYSLDTLGANTTIKALMDDANKYFYGEWALMPQVPKMTSNTTPYGEVIFSDIYGSGYEAYKAFDGVATTRWNGKNSVSNNYIGYHFATPTCIKSVYIDAYGTGNSKIALGGYKIQGSNDNFVSDIHDLYTGNTTGITWQEHIPITVSFDNSASYEYYRLYSLGNPIDTALDSVSIWSLQFYAWQPKGNIPVMTSNTAPYGNAFASNTESATYDNYKAFDGNLTTNWSAGGGGTPRSTNQYVGYSFTNPICAKRFLIAAANPQSATDTRVKNFRIEASNDGFVSQTVTLYTGLYDYNDIYEIIDIDNNNYYLSYRCYVVDNYSPYTIAVTELQFYGRELSVSVPTMTSNTTPYGEVSSRDNYSSSINPYGAFDKSASSNWASTTQSSASTGGTYIQYDFKKDVCVKQISIVVNDTWSGATQLEASCSLVGIKGGVSEVIANFTTPTVKSNTPKFIDVDNTKGYDTYRILMNTLNISANGGAYYYAEFHEIQFYGLDYSEKEFEEGTTKKWLYDHGVELETLTTPNGGVTFGSNQVEISASAANTNYSLDANLDLTDYDLVRFKIGDKYIPTNLEARVNTTEILSWGQSSIAALAASIATNYPNFGLDISAVNGTYYLLWFTNTNSGTPITLKELWLE